MPPDDQPPARAGEPPSGAKLWLAGARPRTLPAAVVPVLVGTAAAAPTFIAWRLAAAMVVALAIQIGTNYANDYSDGVKGTDAADRVGPLRLVGSGLASPGSVKKAALLSFLVAGIAGFALAATVSWWLILVGIVSFAAGWLYTGGPKPYGYYGFGELFVFVFFGLVATVGSSFVQREEIQGLAVVAAVPVGFLATALLVINNLRDIPSDTRAGKKTLAVRIGDQRTRVLYVVLLVGAVLCVPVIAGLGERIYAVLALIAVPFAPPAVTAVLGGATGPALIPVLGATGRIQLIFGAGLAAGLALSA